MAVLWAIPALLGLLLTLLETLLPRSGVRTAAKVALGLLFLDLLAEQILRIIH